MVRLTELRTDSEERRETSPQVEPEMRHQGLGMSFFTAALLAACGTVEPGAQETGLELQPEGNAPARGFRAIGRADFQRGEHIPAPAESRTGDGSLSILNAVGDAFSRPFDTLSQALDPDKLQAAAAKGLSRAVLRQARRQLEEENAYRHPADQIEFDPAPSGRIDPSDTSLAGNYWDAEFTAQSFAPFRPRFEALGFVPLSDLAESRNPLRFDVKVPSASHAQRFAAGEESIRDFIERFEYRASLELSSHGDLVSVVYGSDFVGITFVHPVGRR